jgi:hypothetical protein
MEHNGRSKCLDWAIGCGLPDMDNYHREEKQHHTTTNVHGDALVANDWQ